MYTVYNCIKRFDNTKSVSDKSCIKLKTVRAVPIFPFYTFQNLPISYFSLSAHKLVPYEARLFIAVGLRKSP